MAFGAHNRTSKKKKPLLSKFADAKYMAEQLAQMAKDPEIQAEIASINQEFAATEMDALERLLP